MIGLDSNILLRLVLRDNEDQCRRVLLFLEHEIRSDRKAYVTVIALVEFAWTLRRLYKYSLAETVAAIEMIMDISNLVFERQHIIPDVLDLCRTQRLDFSDALIAAIHRADGCAFTATFDGDFAESGEAVLVP